MSLRGVLEDLARNYSAPRRWHGEDSLRLACSVAFKPADVPASAASAGRSDIPAELVELWTTCDEARLFEDVDYGQWGLVLLDSQSSRERTLQQLDARPAQMRSTDFVVGEFLGDSELLVLAEDDSGASRILVSLPIYPREEWYRPDGDLETFLKHFGDSQAKESSGRRLISNCVDGKTASMLLAATACSSGLRCSPV